MKVLIVSHNVFCKSTNMGRTLMEYFKEFSVDEIAQLYVHSETPTEYCCKNYYRINDQDIIKSIFTRKSGIVLKEKDIFSDLVTSRNDTGAIAQLYQKARKRTPLIYWLRNLWWDLGKWKTEKLLNWVDDFNPDVVFLASGDYSFIYKIALEISKYRNIPLVVSCMDDYYFYNKNNNLLGGKYIHKKFMEVVNKTISYASCIFTICEKMEKDYSAYFHKPCYTLYTPTSIDKPLEFEKKNIISYIGNLGYKRDEQLIKLGRVLKKLKSKNLPEFIDVYSPESRPEILCNLTKNNGINFHGKISYDEVLRVMGSSVAVIHTESFDESIRRSVAYSVSTKIADSLASGTCILVYGPSEIASIQYLQENGAAYCITDNDKVEKALENFFSNHNEKILIVDNAVKLAQKNHNSFNNGEMITKIMKKVINDFKVNFLLR